MGTVKRRWHAPDPTRYVLDGDEPDLEVYEDRQGDVKEGRSAGRGVKGLVAEEHNGSKSKGIVNKVKWLSFCSVLCVSSCCFFSLV